MAKLTYEQSYEDHSYLWSVYGPAHDMTGGYVDQEDLARLLKSPTKTTARNCLESQILYWFQIGPDYTHSYKPKIETLIEDDPMVKQIAIRYGIIDEEWEE